MNTPHEDLEPIEVQSVAVIQEVLPRASLPTLPQPIAAPHSVAQPTAQAALDRAQRAGSRALAEVAYRMRWLGTATLVGCATLVLAATLFIANNLPQSAAVAALRGQLVRLAPLLHSGAVAVPLSATALSALPPRAEAPNIVAKILEEARASGVELPRGQYEYVPARDGVAARYRMTFPVRASYPKLREFMDRTLVALPAVAVDGLRVERKNVGDESVEAELKLSAYVRSEE